MNEAPSISTNDYLLLIGEKEMQNFQLRRENARLLQAGHALVVELDDLKKSHTSEPDSK